MRAREQRAVKACKEEARGAEDERASGFNQGPNKEGSLFFGRRRRWLTVFTLGRHGGSSRLLSFSVSGGCFGGFTLGWLWRAGIARDGGAVRWMVAEFDLRDDGGAAFLTREIDLAALVLFHDVKSQRRAAVLVVMNLLAHMSSVAGVASAED